MIDDSSYKSEPTQLLKYLNKCVETIVDGGVVDSIYIDFAKAFDSVPHRRLMAKLQSYGMKDKVLNWISAAFLSQRTQVVKVNGEESGVGQVQSGIPSSSVLGPILFVIYINDILEITKSDGLL